MPWPVLAAFGGRHARAAAFAELLADIGVSHGLIGPREVDRLWERHLLPSAVPAVLVPRGATVCDVGSGAGLPGLAIALARPDLAVTLVEPMERRCRFLEEAVDRTGLSDQVTVVRARAEDLAADSAAFDAVIARAVARLPRLLELLVPLVRAGGQVLAIKGAGVDAEVTEAADLLDGPRTRRWDRVELPVPGLTGADDRVRLVRVRPAASVRSTRGRGGRRPGAGEHRVRRQETGQR